MSVNHKRRRLTLLSRVIRSNINDDLRQLWLVVVSSSSGWWWRRGAAGSASERIYLFEALGVFARWPVDVRAYKLRVFD